MTQKPKKIRWWWRIALLIVPAAAWCVYVTLVCFECEWSADVPGIGVDVALNARGLTLSNQNASFFSGALPVELGVLSYGFGEYWWFSIPSWEALLLSHIFAIPLFMAWWRKTPSRRFVGSISAKPRLWWRVCLLAVPLAWFVCWLVNLTTPTLSLGSTLGVTINHGVIVFGKKPLSADDTWKHAVFWRFTTESFQKAVFASSSNFHDIEVPAIVSGIKIDWTKAGAVGPQIVFWLLFLLCVWPLVKACRIRSAIANSFASDVCVFCGYPKKGLPGPICPECGSSEFDIRPNKPTCRMWWRRMLLLVPLVAWCAFFVAIAHHDKKYCIDEASQTSLWIEYPWIAVSTGNELEDLPPSLSSLVSLGLSEAICSCFWPLHFLFAFFSEPDGTVFLLKLWLPLLLAHVFVLPLVIARRRRKRYQRYIAHLRSSDQ